MITPARTADEPFEVHYPESDGKPLGETGLHIRELIDARDILRHLYRDADDVYVGANQFVYFSEGDPSAVVAPDVFVVKGVPKRERRTFKIWEEGAAPVWVLELTSRSTRYEDITSKRNGYEALGVQEYFLFDPEEDYLHPALQGYRLVGGRYERIPLAADRTLHSQVIGVKLSWEGDRLLWIDSRSGERLLTSPERAEALAEQTQALAKRAEEQAKRAEEQAKRAEEQAKRAEEQARRAGLEEQARREAEARAQAAEERTSAMEAELERLRALLEKGWS